MQPIGTNTYWHLFSRCEWCRAPLIDEQGSNPHFDVFGTPPVFVCYERCLPRRRLPANLSDQTAHIRSDYLAPVFNHLARAAREAADRQARIEILAGWSRAILKRTEP